MYQLSQLIRLYEPLGFQLTNWWNVRYRVQYFSSHPLNSQYFLTSSTIPCLPFFSPCDLYTIYLRQTSMNSKCAIIMKKNHMKNMYNKKHSCFFPKSTTLIYFVRFLLRCIKIEKNRLAALERYWKVFQNFRSRLWILKNQILYNLEYGIWNEVRIILRLVRWINSKYENVKILWFSFFYLS